MANGFCPALLNDFADIAGNQYAGNKVTMPGFTKFLYDQQNRVSVGDQGHRRTVTFKYLQRGTPNQVSTTPGCTVDAVPAFIETTVPLTMFVQKGIFLGEDTIRQYCQDASNKTSLGGSQHMDVVARALYASMNSLYSKMESLLLTKLGLNMGKHVETASAAAVTINFEQDGTLNDLDTGITALLTRAQTNELCGPPSFIYGMGSLMHHFDNQAKSKAFGLAASGVDQSKLIDNLGYAGYSSAHVTAALGGAENVAMVHPDQIWLVENMRNKGSFAGTPAGSNSTFTTLIDPRTQCWGNVPVEWDMQAKYIDCAEAFSDAVGNGYITSSSVTEDRGYLIILSKYFDLFVNPVDVFEGGDRMAGGNRPLLYTISNT
jgi:hypothetical protein